MVKISAFNQEGKESLFRRGAESLAYRIINKQLPEEIAVSQLKFTGHVIENSAYSSVHQSCDMLLEKLETIVIGSEDSVKEAAFGVISQISEHKPKEAVNTLKSIAKYIPANQKLQKSESIFKGFSKAALKIVKKHPEYCDDELMNGVSAVGHMQDIKKVSKIKRAFGKIAKKHTNGSVCAIIAAKARNHFGMKQF